MGQLQHAGFEGSLVRWPVLGFGSQLGMVCAGQSSALNTPFACRFRRAPELSVVGFFRET